MSRFIPRFIAASPLRLLMIGALALCLNACALLAPRDPLNIDVVGIDPLPGQGMELRFAVRLRLQNPNTEAIDYDGIALALSVNDLNFASGVSDAQGSVPRFGEAIVVVPVSISAFSALRQAYVISASQGLNSLPYVLHGKLSTGPFGSVGFSDKGTLVLPKGNQGW